MTYSFGNYHNILKHFKMDADTIYRTAAGLMVGDCCLNDNCISPFEAATEMVDYADELLQDMR